MILRVIRSNSPSVLLFFLIVPLIIWYPSFNNPDMVLFSFDEVKMPLYELFYQWFSPSGFFSIFIPFLLILIQAFFILKINREYIIVQKQNYLPTFIFILVVSGFIALQRVNPVVFASLFIILMLDQLFACYRKRYVLNRLFMAGFFVGIASLFYSFAAIYLIIIWVGLFVLRSLSLREWFVPVLGFIFPFLFVFATYYIHEQLSVVGLINEIRASLFNSTTITHFHISYILFYALIVLFIIFGSFSVIRRFPGRKIYVRKFFEILWWMFVAPVLLLVLINPVYAEIIYLIAIPITFLISDYVNSIKNRMLGNTLFFMLFGAIVYILLNQI